MRQRLSKETIKLFFVRVIFESDLKIIGKNNHILQSTS